jgi:hypothetical protein
MARHFSTRARLHTRVSAAAMIVAGVALTTLGAFVGAGPAAALPSPCSSFSTYYCTQIVSGNGQTTTTGTAFAQPLEIQIGFDGVFANGETVTFKIDAASVAAHFGSSGSSTTATSDSSGYASTTVALTPTSPGTVIVDAYWYDGDTLAGTVVFRLTACGPAVTTTTFAQPTAAIAAATNPCAPAVPPVVIVIPTTTTSTTAAPTTTTTAAPATTTTVVVPVVQPESAPPSTSAPAVSAETLPATGARTLRLVWAGLALIAVGLLAVSLTGGLSMRGVQHRQR